MMHEIFRQLRSLASLPFDFIYPPLCLLCDDYLQAGEELVCRPCFRRLPQLQDPDVPATALRTPLRHPPCFDRAIALYDYQESTGTIIHFFKYNGGRSLARPLGQALGQALLDGGYEVRALVPVPLHASRLRERGYNQSELLARAMAAATGIPVWPQGLRRVVATPPQARMGRQKRLRNLRGAFIAPDPERLAEGSFVLVDDVLTTGHTLDECARVMMSHGAERVIAATIARVQ
jgi:competence protein ComFC